MKQRQTWICSLSSRRTTWSRQMHMQGMMQHIPLTRGLGMSEVCIVCRALALCFRCSKSLARASLLKRVKDPVAGASL